VAGPPVKKYMTRKATTSRAYSSAERCKNRMCENAVNLRRKSTHVSGISRPGELLEAAISDSNASLNNSANDSCNRAGGIISKPASLRYG
jgi:hypothetical protein